MEDMASFFEERDYIIATVEESNFDYLNPENYNTTNYVIIAVVFGVITIAGLILSIELAAAGAVTLVVLLSKLTFEFSLAGAITSLGLGEDVAKQYRYQGGKLQDKIKKLVNQAIRD